MTTAAVVAYYSQGNEAKISYAGHPPILYKRAGDKAWSYARPPGRKDQIESSPLNIPLAVDLDTHYRQFSIPMAPGDRIFVYTDGIIDAPSPAGESFGLARLKDILDANAGLSLSGIKTAILRALRQYTKNALTHDDITLIVLQIC